MAGSDSSQSSEQQKRLALAEAGDVVSQFKQGAEAYNLQKYPDALHWFRLAASKNTSQPITSTAHIKRVVYIIG